MPVSQQNPKLKMDQGTTSYLSLGSNLGDRLANLQQARELLVPLASGKITCAPVYQTAPLHCPPDSPAFLNTALSFETKLSPQELLTATQGIEAELGRAEKGTRAINAPRPIDIDILLFDETVLTTPHLTIPHPRLHERLFVLHPLRDLAPSLTPPTHANPVSILLEICETTELPPLLLHQEW